MGYCCRIGNTVDDSDGTADTVVELEQDEFGIGYTVE